MRFPTPLSRRGFLAFVAIATLAACGDDKKPTENEENPNTSIAGTYTATVFQVTPSNSSMINMLAGGSTLTITIAENMSTTGSLFIPGTIGGGSDFNASMSGTAVRSGNSVTFQQTADSFVRDLTFAISGKTLQVTNQTAGGAAFTITLTRP